MAVTHLELSQQGEAVKSFFESLQISSEGLVIELNGHAVARVFPVVAKKPNDNKEWTNTLNDRRCDLIDKKYDATLSPEEEAELATLQEQMLRYRRKVAPFPIEDTRRLYHQLLHDG